MNQIELGRKIEDWIQEYGHQYNPPVSPARLAELEFVIGCTLPVDYRRFLLNIADGGTNGYDALVSTSEQLEIYLGDQANLRVSLPFPFTVEHARLFASGDEHKLVLPPEIWDGNRFGADGLNGTIVIQHSGYVGNVYLVVMGELFGRVCYTGDGVAGIYPMASFTEWLVSDEWSYNCG